MEIEFIQRVVVTIARRLQEPSPERREILPLRAQMPALPGGRGREPPIGKGKGISGLSCEVIGRSNRPEVP